eukprot:scaffold273768_cov17-Tisochrysis_lutea.AAC.1
MAMKNGGPAPDQAHQEPHEAHPDEATQPASLRPVTAPVVGVSLPGARTRASCASPNFLGEWCAARSLLLRVCVRTKGQLVGKTGAGYSHVYWASSNTTRQICARWMPPGLANKWSCERVRKMKALLGSSNGLLHECMGKVEASGARSAVKGDRNCKKAEGIQSKRLTISLKRHWGQQCPG